MGVVHPSSEGVPGGLSAAGQRRRMAGCGAPGSSVSRLSPSIPRTCPAKRLRRYGAASLLPHSRSLSCFVLCTSVCLPRSTVHSPTYMHTTQTHTAWVLNRFHCESEAPALGLPTLYWSIQKTPSWLIITDLVDCTHNLKIESLFYVLYLFFFFPLLRFLAASLSLPFWLTLVFPSTATLLLPHLQLLSSKKQLYFSFSSIIWIMTELYTREIVHFNVNQPSFS